MRIKVVRRPNDSCIDGVRLDLFVPGHQYDVGTTLGMLFLAEGWGEPAEGNAPAMVIPASETARCRRSATKSRFWRSAIAKAS